MMPSITRRASFLRLPITSLSTTPQVPASQKHTNNWSLQGVAGLPANGKLDLGALGLGETSMSVRTGRNLKAFA